MAHPDDGPRVAVPADGPAVREVVQAAFAGYVPHMDRPPAPLLADLTPNIAAGEVWVAGHPVVGAGWLVARSDALHVEMLAVDPRAQGRGVGRRLLETAADEARRAGYDRLVLSTNEVMTASAAVYRHLGFVEVGRGVEEGYRRIVLEQLLS